MVNENKKTIFISYGRDEKNPQDVELVRKIKQDLGKEGFEVLIDEEQLRVGIDWEIKLENMIEESDLILFFITPYSARRPEGFCLNELAMAITRNKSIAPMMLTYTVPPLSICRLQYLDLQTIKDNHYEKMLNKIIDIANGKHVLAVEGEHLIGLNALRPLKFDNTIAKYSYKFRGREWVYEEVEKWLKEKDNSRVLLMQAEAGFGKSAIAAFLASKHPSALGIHFCQYDFPESKDVREMLKVLIFQLSTQIEVYYEILQTINIKEHLEKSAVHIYTQLLLEPLQKIDNPNEKYFFIIDAVDEAENEDSNEIIEFISSRFVDLPSWLNIIITSRIEPRVSRKLKKFNPIELRAADKRNNDDLDIFLKESENIQDERLRKALIQKSEGNILYLNSIFEFKMIETSELTIESIEQLPLGMESFYLTYFERKFNDVKLYEEKYLMFVSLLTLQQGMPELLHKDILQLAEREYKKIKNHFGSLLEIDNGQLTFYHKTIYEWLSDYDMSGDYSANLVRGREKFDEFIDDLSAESYKEDYLQFIFFNQQIIDRFYEQDGSLKRFFEILKAGTNEIEKIATLNILALDYQSNVAIELSKESLNISEKFYKKYPEIGAHAYTVSLNNLASRYKENNDKNEAMKLEKKSFKILEKLYPNNRELWVVESYVRVLNNLANSYRENDVGESIKLLEESRVVCNELYEKTPEAWTREYATALGNLALLYANNNDIPDAIELWEESLPILKELSKKGAEVWIGRYAELLVRLTVTYSHIGKIDEVIKYGEQSLRKLKKLYYDNPKQWSDYYSKIHKELLDIYENENRRDEIEVLKKEHREIYDLNSKSIKPKVQVSKKTRRNDPCPCNSGKKYKKCCGKNQ